MNLIQAIQKARLTGKSGVSYPDGFNYISMGLTCSVAPGPLSTDYIVAIIGGLPEHVLLSNDWQVEEERITVTYSQLCKALNGPISPMVAGDGVAIDLKDAWKFLKYAVEGREIPPTRAMIEDQEEEEERNT